MIGLLGGLAGSSSLAFGTSAFTSVSAERSVSVSVADDDKAFLQLTERGAGRRSYEDGGTVGFDIPSPDEGDYGGTNPEGLGTDSVYRFGSDAAHNESGLLAVQNQGTQPIQIYSTQETTDGIPSITLYNVDTQNLLTENSPSEKVSVGGQLVCGLEIDTSDVPIKESDYDVQLTINAVGIGSD